MNIQNFYQGPKNAVNIDDCFTYNQKTDYFTGENKNYCNICKQLSESYYTSRIYVCPDILILILNRGKGNIYKVKMNFNEVIDITNYVIQNENKRVIYNLYGVITHIGESGPNAHFVASCKSPVDGKWYRYNDAKVDPIQNFQKDIHDFCSPYILFYEKNI
jgi:ubiquitin C-terminal hydrolase